MLTGYIKNEIEKDSGVLLYYPEEIKAKSNEPDANIAVYFDVIKSHSIQINDNITDNWLENSTVVNDCINQSPIIVTLSGISGEVVYSPSVKSGWLKELYDNINGNGILGEYANEYITTDKLTIIPELYPPVDNNTQTAKNVITTVESNVKRYEKILNKFLSKKSERNGTRLQKIYDDLTELRYISKITGNGLTAETPFGTLENMFIQSIDLKQDDLGFIADISITLKQGNFSETQTAKADPNTLAELNSAAKAQEKNKGKAAGINSELYNQLNKFTKKPLPYTNS